MRFNLALCYASTEEMWEVMDKVAFSSSEVTSELIDSNLWGGFNCKPDILIRTSGEIRYSNFMLY